MEAKYEGMEAKMNSIAKIIQLLQMYSETQEQEARSIRKEFKEIRRIHEENSESKRLATVERRLEMLEENLQARRKLEKNMKQMIAQQGADIAEDMNSLERKIRVGYAKEGIYALQSAVNAWVEDFESQLNVFFSITLGHCAASRRQPIGNSEHKVQKAFAGREEDREDARE